MSQLQKDMAGPEKKTKAQIRKDLNIKTRGKMQINTHGCNQSSILIFAKTGVHEYNCKTTDLYK